MTLIDLIFRLPSRVGRLVRKADRLSNSCDLAALIYRERARVNRSGGEFSVVTFGDITGSANRKALRQIEAHLARRARVIDEVGWTNQRQLWLLLPCCPADAARMIARDICQSVCAGQDVVSYHVYHYIADNGTRAQNGTYQKQRSRSSATSEMECVPGSNADSSELPCETHAVESFVARAMPWSKRALDFAVAMIAITVLSPVFAIVSLVVKLSSSGPIVFTQIRAGRGGKPFRMYKFRTMVVNAEQLKSELMTLNEQDGPAFKMKHDPRITTIGRVLRATSIDELPQLWNVLLGDMSLVGPRPLPLGEAEKCAPWQQERLDITPGLTCWWQVCDRWSNMPFADWMRMDIRYARRRSLRTDLTLILRTIAFVIRRRGT